MRSEQSPGEVSALSGQRSEQVWAKSWHGPGWVGASPGKARAKSLEGPARPPDFREVEFEKTCVRLAMK
jgi:hypothetical protein